MLLLCELLRYFRINFKGGPTRNSKRVNVALQKKIYLNSYLKHYLSVVLIFLAMVTKKKVTRERTSVGLDKSGIQALTELNFNMHDCAK